MTRPISKTQIARRLEWIDALRSGEYKQDAEGGQLRTTHDTYCCLGVVCDLFMPSNWNPMKKPFDKMFYSHGSEQNWAVPAPKLVRKVGLSHDSTEVDNVEFESDMKISVDTCVDMNDLLHMSFDEIADVLLIDLLERSAYKHK